MVPGVSGGAGVMLFVPDACGACGAALTDAQRRWPFRVARLKDLTAAFLFPGPESVRLPDRVQTFWACSERCAARLALRDPAGKSRVEAA